MTEGSSRFRPQKPIFCNRCGNKTIHNLKGEHSRDFYGDDPLGGLLYEETEVYLFWVCAGCGRGTLEMASIHKDDIDDSGYHRYFSGRYYPRRAQHEVSVKSFKKLPRKLERIYRETIDAFNDGLSILCAAGLRSIVEGICDNKGILVNEFNLRKRIDAMEGELNLPGTFVKNLHSYRFMGKYALHKLSPPEKDDLRLAIEVIEDLLNFLYELDYKASVLPDEERLKPPRAKVIKLKDEKKRDK